MLPTRITSHENGAWVECYEVISHSNPSISYVVSKHRDGHWGCSCPRWIYTHKDCKHVKEVVLAISDTSQAQKMQTGPMTDRIRKAMSRFAFVEID